MKTMILPITATMALALSPIAPAGLFQRVAVVAEAGSVTGQVWVTEYPDGGIAFGIGGPAYSEGARETFAQTPDGESDVDRVPDNLAGRLEQANRTGQEVTVTHDENGMVTSVTLHPAKK